MTGRTRVNDRLYEHIVIGKSVMGSAAARYLSAMGAQVALIGPDEPADRWTHQGVFASWLACETDASQERETMIACELLNRMRVLGRPQSYPVL